jgi:hypothetical protein
MSWGPDSLMQFLDSKLVPRDQTGAFLLAHPVVVSYCFVTKDYQQKISAEVTDVGSFVPFLCFGLRTRKY